MRWWLVGVLVWAYGGVGWAQDLSVLQLGGELPLELEAENLRIDREKKMIVLEGGVVAQRGALVLRAERMEAMYNEDVRKVEMLTVLGGIDIKVGKGVRVQGEKASYEVGKGRLKVEGDPVVLNRDGSILRGGALVFDFVEGTVQISGGRVQGVFAPGR